MDVLPIHSSNRPHNLLDLLLYSRNFIAFWHICLAYRQTNKATTVKRTHKSSEIKCPSFCYCARQQRSLCEVIYSMYTTPHIDASPLWMDAPSQQHADGAPSNIQCVSKTDTSFSITTSVSSLIMVALCNRADHYIFILFLSSFFLLSFFFF